MINQERIKNLLLELVQIDSHSRKERDVAAIGSDRSQNVARKNRHRPAPSGGSSCFWGLVLRKSARESLAPRSLSRATAQPQSIGAHWRAAVSKALSFWDNAALPISGIFRRTRRRLRRNGKGGARRGFVVETTKEISLYCLGDHAARGGALVDPSSCEQALAETPCFCRSAHSSIGKSGPNRILTVGDSAMFAVYVLGDTWRLHATFSTRDAAESLVARLVSRGVRAKLFRTAETQRGAA